MATKTAASAKRLGGEGSSAPSDMFELVTRALNVAYYEWIAESDEYHFSPALLQLFGYKPEDITPPTLWEAMHPDDREGVRTAVAGFFRSREERAEFTYRLRMPTGETKWAHAYGLAQRDPNGMVTRVVGALSDITEAKQREAENRALIARQAASIQVLKIISASPDDLQPVFELIARRARELCHAVSASVTEYDGALLHLRALDGFDAVAADVLYRTYPRRANDETVNGRMTLSGQIIHIRDAAAYHRDLPALTELGRTLRDLTREQGVNSLLGVPLLHEGRAIGGFLLRRKEVGGFDDTEIALVQSFAEQAVIAITSAKTRRELAARNEAYREQVEHQAATIDVLKVMSSSTSDTQPVFDIILRRAMQLCGSPAAGMFEYDGELIHIRAARGFPSEAYEEFARQYPMAPGRDLVAHRAVLDGQVIYAPDIAAELGIPQSAITLGHKCTLAIPLMRDGKSIGTFSLTHHEIDGLRNAPIELLKAFADQAVIAIGSAETFRALQQRTAELAARNSAYGERIEHQAATIDVLKAMSASPDDPQPVFDLLVRRAQELCNGAGAGLFEYDGTLVHFRADCGVAMITTPEALAAHKALYPMAPTRSLNSQRALLDKKIVHVRDMEADPESVEASRALGLASEVHVPLIRDGEPVGVISLVSMKKGGFSDTQVELLKTFAEQAVIAIRSAEAFRALEQRTRDLSESLEQQTATADVLKVISRSAFDLGPVFQAVLETAVRLCRADQATIYRYKDGEYRWAAGYSLSPDYERIEREVSIRPGTGTLVGRVALEGRTVQILDAWIDPLYAVKEDARVGGVHTMLGVPLQRDGVPIGVFGLARRRVEPYTDRQIELVSTFADQAVIAIENARLFDAVQKRTQELAQSVAELQALEEVLRAVNSSLDLDTVLATIISRAVPLAQADEGMIYEFDTADEVFVPKAAYGMSEDRIIRVRERRIRIGETYLGRSAVERRPIHVADVQHDESTPEAPEYLPGIHAVLAVPLLQGEKVIGGMAIRRRSENAFAPATVTLIQTFAGQSVLAIGNARLFQDAEHARAAAEAALNDLRRAQDRLIQSEKMASLGQLTAGIAHEIKNPLNFVNNFSALSTELVDELRGVLAKVAIDGPTRAEVEGLGAMIKGNLEKVVQHGKRADGIVKNMLLHARESGGERRSVDLNATIEEALNLAYHGARAEKPGFNITLERQFDPRVGNLEIYPQEFTRVMLNLFSNGFYAANRKAQDIAGGDFQPTLTVATEAVLAGVIIRVRDNGTGIPDSAKARLFEPFFTTKPAGEGTGLGLSLSHDIVVKQHGGSIAVDSEPGEYTEFTITLPRLETRAPS